MRTQMTLPKGVRIRPVRRGDRDSVYRLLAETGVSVPPIDQSVTLSWMVSHPEIEMLLAVDATDQGVGLLSLSHRPQLRTGGRLATVDALVVTERLRGQGIGSALLERVFARVRTLGIRLLKAEVDGEQARGFLERRGFAPSAGHVMSWAAP